MGWQNEGRTYDGPVGKLWSVTTILAIIDKSGALIQWAANTAADYIDYAVRAFLNDNGHEMVHVPLKELDAIVARAKRAHRAIKTEAGDIGTQVHKLIEEYSVSGCHMTPPADLDPRVDNAFGLFLEWSHEVDLEIVEVEIPVYDPKNQYAGRLDMIAKGRFNPKWRRKRTYLVDTKTSKGFYNTFGPQVAAYNNGYPGKLDGAGVIRVGKEDGLPEWRDYTKDLKKDLAVFLAAKNLYLAMKGRPK